MLAARPGFARGVGQPSRVLVARLGSGILVGAVMCGCHSTQHPASPTSPSAAATTQSPAPVVNIAPLPVRPVAKSQPTTPDKCPATNPNAPAAPTNVLTTCNLDRTTLYTLLPQAITLGLTHVDSPTPAVGANGASYYEVYVTLDASSAAAWASYMAGHIGQEVAFIRDDLVLSVGGIVEPDTTGKIVLDAPTAQVAQQVIQLVNRST